MIDQHFNQIDLIDLNSKDNMGDLESKKIFTHLIKYKYSNIKKKHYILNGEFLKSVKLIYYIYFLY